MEATNVGCFRNRTWLTINHYTWHRQWRLLNVTYKTIGFNSRHRETLLGKGHSSKGSKYIYIYLCEGCHRAAEFHFKDLICHNCGKQGHIAKVYRSRAKRSQSSSAFRQIGNTSSTVWTRWRSQARGNSLYSIKNPPNHRPIDVIAESNWIELALEVDAGATLSHISKATCDGYGMGPLHLHWNHQVFAPRHIQANNQSIGRALSKYTDQQATRIDESTCPRWQWSQPPRKRWAKESKDRLASDPSN